MHDYLAQQERATAEAVNRVIVKGEVRVSGNSSQESKEIAELNSCRRSEEQSWPRIQDDPGIIEALNHEEAEETLDKAEKFKPNHI